MSDIKIDGMTQGMDLPNLKKPGSGGAGEGFEKIMNEVNERLSQVQSDTDKAVRGLTSGGDITQAIIAMEQADMNFQLMIEVRNKLISAYQEIMKISV